MTTPPAALEQIGTCISAGVTRTTQGHYFKREPGFPYWTVGTALGADRYILTPHTPAKVHRPANLISLTLPNTPYETIVDHGPFENHYAIFTPGPLLLPLLNWHEDFPGVRSLPLHDPDTLALARQALIQATNAVLLPHPHARALAMASLLQLFLLAQPKQNHTRTSPPDPRIARALQAIHERPEHPWTVPLLARAASLSPSSLAHLFKTQTGLSPMHYITARRVDKARHLLLATNLSISQIADQLGFANPFHFSTRFRQFTGQSPRQYRLHPKHTAI